MVYSLAQAASEGSKFPFLERDADARMMEQLRLSKNQLKPLSETLATMHGMSYSLSMSEDDLPPSMQEQLAVSENQLKQQPATSEQGDAEPLPRTFEDALRSRKRAIVITETTKPFRVVDVNKAWEGLCEYSNRESKGKSLGCLLRGTETDPLAVTALVSQLLRGEEAGTILTNYTKSGRPFRNRLRVGPIFNDAGNLTHFVGVLQEMKM
jgi:PAS domain-containing protein